MPLDLGGISRIAIYFAPPTGSALARLGAAWLGTEADTGRTAEAMPEPPRLPRPREALVARPSVYGLHATLKAPFRLAEAIDAETLDAAVTALAAGLRPAEGPPLRVLADLGFVALRPDGPCPEIDALATACVTELDGLRAPLSAAEIARRARDDLDTVEEMHFRRWGYPHVLDRFRFHMTLTGALPQAEAEQAAAVLDPVFAPALEPRLRIDALTLFGDPGNGGRFRILKRYPLGSAADTTNTTGRPAP